MKLSYLDFGLLKEGAQSINRIHELFEMSPYLEGLGYNRIWLGEHHSYDIAWRSPEVLMSLILGVTDKIKVGSAGNLIDLHAPLKLVQNYSILEGLFSGRVDLGLAFGTADIINREFLTNNKHGFEIKSKLVKEISDLFHPRFEKESPYYGITIPPYIKGLRPDIWFLSTSDSKSDLAIKTKANYVWSLFHKKKERWVNGDCIKRYKEAYFKANDSLPEVAVAISGICLENNEKTLNNIKSIYKDNFYTNLVGNLDLCYSKLYEIQKRYDGLEEIVILDLNLNLEGKKESALNFSRIVKQL